MYYTLEHEVFEVVEKDRRQILMRNSSKLYNLANPQKRTTLYDLRLAVISQ